MPGTRRSNGNLDTTYKFGYPFNLTPPSACLLLCDCSFICNYLVLIALFSFLCSCSRSLPSLWGWSHTGSSRTWCTPEYVAACMDSIVHDNDSKRYSVIHNIFWGWILPSLDNFKRKPPFINWVIKPSQILFLMIILIKNCGSDYVQLWSTIWCPKLFWVTMSKISI